MYVCTQVVLLISDKPELLGTDNNINISLYVAQTIYILSLGGA